MIRIILTTLLASSFIVAFAAGKPSRKELEALERFKITVRDEISHWGASNFPGINKGDDTDFYISLIENRRSTQSPGLYPKYAVLHFSKKNSEDKNVYSYVIVKDDAKSEWKVDSGWMITPTGERSSFENK